MLNFYEQMIDSIVFSLPLLSSVQLPSVAIILFWKIFEKFHIYQHHQNPSWNYMKASKAWATWNFFLSFDEYNFVSVVWMVSNLVRSTVFTERLYLDNKYFNNIHYFLVLRFYEEFMIRFLNYVNKSVWILNKSK